MESVIGRSNKELEAIKMSYQKMYKTSLEEDISEDLSGKFQNLMIALINVRLFMISFDILSVA